MNTVHLGATWSFDFEFASSFSNSDIELKIISLSGEVLMTKVATLDASSKGRINVQPDEQTVFAAPATYQTQTKITSGEGGIDIVKGFFSTRTTY